MPYSQAEAPAKDLSRGWRIRRVTQEGWSGKMPGGGGGHRDPGRNINRGKLGEPERQVGEAVVELDKDEQSREVEGLCGAWWPSWRGAGGKVTSPVVSWPLM